MADYMSSAFRQSGKTTIAEHRLNEAFKQGQRDAEQGWPANASRWDFVGPLAAGYHSGYVQPRTADNRCPHGGTIGECSWCDLRDDGGLPESH